MVGGEVDFITKPLALKTPVYVHGWLYVLGPFLPITLLNLPVKSHRKTLWLLWLGRWTTDSSSELISAFYINPTYLTHTHYENI